MTRPERPWRRPHPLVGAALAGFVSVGAAVALGGCTSSAPDQSTPQAALTSLYHALGHKDFAQACQVIASNGSPTSGTAGQQCVAGLTSIFGQVPDPQGDLPKLAAATVTGASITGDTAKVAADQITGLPAGYATDVELVRVDGRWYVDSLAGLTG